MDGSGRSVDEFVCSKLLIFLSTQLILEINYAVGDIFLCKGIKG